MTYKIILGTLDQHAFPENYPYLKDHMKEETKLAKNPEEMDEQSWQNLRFVVRAAGHSLSVKDEDVRYIMSRLYKRMVEAHFNWQKEYNWQELKVVLFFFLSYAKMHDLKGLKQSLKNKKLTAQFEKYHRTQPKAGTQLALF